MAKLPNGFTSRDHFYRVMNSLPPPLNVLRGHSFKRGSAKVLFVAASEKKLDPGVLPAVLKHKHQGPIKTQVLPSITIRYGSEAVATAILGGTGQATALL